MANWNDEAIQELKNTLGEDVTDDIVEAARGGFYFKYQKRSVTGVAGSKLGERCGIAPGQDVKEEVIISTPTFDISEESNCKDEIERVGSILAKYLMKYSLMQMKRKSNLWPLMDCLFVDGDGNPLDMIVHADYKASIDIRELGVTASVITMHIEYPDVTGDYKVIWQRFNYNWPSLISGLNEAMTSRLLARRVFLVGSDQLLTTNKTRINDGLVRPRFEFSIVTLSEMK